MLLSDEQKSNETLNQFFVYSHSFKYSFSSLIDRDGKIIPITSEIDSYINDKWIFSKTTYREIENYKYAGFYLFVQPDGKMSPTERTILGTYVFDVNVSYEEDNTWKQYDKIQKFYVIV
jgi:hypothetical protein